MMDAYLGDRRKDEIVREFLAQRLPVSPVRSYQEAAADAHVRERDMLQDVELEDGTIAPIVGPAAKFSRTPTRVRSGAPALGAHDDEILAELGIGADERKALRDQGVI
jgi:formyl-CoA transferase